MEAMPTDYELGNCVTETLLRNIISHMINFDELHFRFYPRKI